MSLSTRILMGLSLGLIIGIAWSVYGQQISFPLTAWIEPIGTLWVNAIRMTVIPLLMALLITAIAGQSNSGVVATLGGKSLVLFVLMALFSSLFALLFAPPLLSLLAVDATASESLLASVSSPDVIAEDLPPFRDWLVNLIPANPLKAAADNAILPLMIFTALFASALLYIEEARRRMITDFFEAIKESMFVLIGWIMSLAPIGIFALVFPLAATLGVNAITTLASFIFIACALLVSLTLLLYPLASVLGRLSLSDFTKAVAPAQVIAFSTRSSLATLPATFTVTERLGLSNKISGVVLPIAVSLFKFASPLARTTGTYFIAILYGIELDFISLLTIALAICLFSFYSPGIPSGGLLIMAPVYISLGLPVEGIGILIAIDLIVDMFITTANVTANVTAVAVLSRQDR